MATPARRRVRQKQKQPNASTLAAAAAVSTAAPGRPAVNLRLISAAAALLMLVAASYANSLSNGFTWDDQLQIVMNPELRPDAPLRQILFSDLWGFSSFQGAAEGNKIYYRPLQMITYRAMVAIFGLNPAAFHLLSVLYTGAAAILSLSLFWVLTRRIAVAFAAAALFAVHPIHTEAVDWASAMPDLGCTVFLLAAFLLFLLASRLISQQESHAVPRGRLQVWALSLACFAAALLWKETAAVLPLLVAAYVFILPTKSSLASRLRDAAAFSLPFWAVLGAYLFLRFRVLGHIATSQRNWELSLLQFGLTASHLMMNYWRKLIVPVPLNAYYVFAPVRSALTLAAISAVLFLTLATLAIIYLARRLPLLGFTALWVFITLLPAMDIYAVGRNVFTERYLFLPSVGFCLFLVILAFEVFQRMPERFRKAVGVSALVIILALSAYETWARNHDWKDNAVLFAMTLETSPNAPFVQNMVADTQLSDSTGSQSAETHYFRALALASAEQPPDRLQMARACEHLALIYSDRSDFARAIDYLERVRSIDPRDPEVDGEEGLIMARAGRWGEAAQFLQRAVAAAHENENVLNALGILAQQHTHQLDQAAAYFSRALAIHAARDEFSASLHNNLGAVYGEAGRYARAVEEFQIATSIAPNDPEYHTNLASALAATGQYDAAHSEIRKALAIAPDYQSAIQVLRELDRH